MQLMLPPTESFHTPAACWIVHSASRVDIQTKRVLRRSEWPARSRPPHPAELAKELPRPRPGGRWSAVRGALQLVVHLEEDGPRLVPASYVTTGSQPTFDHMVRTHGSSPLSSFLRCSLFSDALPQEAYVKFLLTRQWEVTAALYRERIATYAIQPRDILLQLPNRRLHFAPHVQEFPAGLHVEQEEHLTRWTFGVRHPLDVGDPLAAFPTATADTLKVVGPGLEIEPLIMGRKCQGGTAVGAIENRQTSENRDATSERQVETPRITPMAVTSLATATSTRSCDGECELAARGRRGRPTGSERGSRAASGDKETARAGGEAQGRVIEHPSSEGGQGGRVADTWAPSIHCVEDVDYSAGASGDAEPPVAVTCSNRGFVHARYMWDRAQRLTNGHVDPHPWVTCRSG